MDQPAHLPRHAGWSRAVFAGLALLLMLTVQAMCSVLIQPFSGTWGGAAPTLNMPGPKLWAAPLLQRPLGYGPYEEGVSGTRAAILSLLAVWLITWPPSRSRGRQNETLRLLTRWVSVVLFGLAYGLMMAKEGMPRTDLPALRLLLIGAVELPAATLLYAYFLQLAGNAFARDGRIVFDRLAWLVPMVMFFGAAALAVRWINQDVKG
jgi:hypothetical protein